MLKPFCSIMRKLKPYPWSRWALDVCLAACWAMVQGGFLLGECLKPAFCCAFPWLMDKLSTEITFLALILLFPGLSQRSLIAWMG